MDGLAATKDVIRFLAVTNIPSTRNVSLIVISISMPHLYKHTTLAKGENN